MNSRVCLRVRTLRRPPGRLLSLAVLLSSSLACQGPEPEHDQQPAQASDASQLASDATLGESRDAGSERAAGDDAGARPVLQPDAGEPRDAGEARDAGGNMSADAGRVRDASPPGNASDASTGDASAGDASTGDPGQVAAALNGFFLDVPCAPSTPTPLTEGATCTHPTGTQRIEKKLTLGGLAGTVYTITLRVRGVWEPTTIQGGQRPDKAHPFTVGGMPPPGMNASDPINYQQYSLLVSEPKQTYWFNDHQYVAHAIHKEDYQATIRAAGGAQISVIMNDGNDRQIANFTKDYFAGLPPYDKAPSTGQSLRLDVLSVTSAP